MAIPNSMHGIPTSIDQMTQTRTDEGNGFTVMASPKGLGIFFSWDCFAAPLPARSRRLFRWYSIARLLAASQL